jgi:hypothetical protein
MTSTAKQYESLKKKILTDHYNSLPKAGESHSPSASTLIDAYFSYADYPVPEMVAYTRGVESLNLDGFDPKAVSRHEHGEYAGNGKRGTSDITKLSDSQIVERFNMKFLDDSNYES